MPIKDSHTSRESKGGSVIIASLAASVCYTNVDSFLGEICVAYSPRGIVYLRVTKRGDVFQREVQRKTGHNPVYVQPLDDPAAGRNADAVAASLAGQAQSAHVDLAAASTFQHAVLELASRIERGTVRTYSWIALRLGKPAAARAVANALARNPVPLIIPCHRVVRRDEQVGGYSMGGPATKRLLLSREGVDSGDLAAACQ